MKKQSDTTDRYIKARAPKNKRALSVLMTIAAFVICSIIVLVSVSPPKYDIKAGDIATTTIQAPRDVVDNVTTQEQIDRAVENVSPIYKQDQTVTEAVHAGVNRYFEYMEKVRSYCENKRILAQSESAEETVADWQTVIGPSMELIMSLCEDTFTSAEVYRIANLSADDVKKMSEQIPEMMDTELNRGVKEENLDEHITSLSTQIVTDIAYSTDMTRLALKAIDMLAPNLMLDEDATLAAREEATASVVPVSYKEGQNVIQEGEVVTLAQVEVLRELGYLESGTSYKLYLGTGIYMAVVFGAFVWYMLQVERKVMADIKCMAMMMITFVLVTGITLLLSLISKNLTAVFLGAVLIGAVTKPRTAVFASIAMAFITAPIGSTEGAFTMTTFATLCYSLVGGIASALMTRQRQHRMSFILAGLVGGFAGALMVMAFGLVNEDMIGGIWASGAFVLLSGLVSGMLTIGVLPLFEYLFRLPTASRLLELLNPNQKLLRRLSIEAPGTYHHSTIMANLAEAAAEAIEGNALLTRTAAYYHDIGKIKSPEMYTENQHGFNPHDTMEPEQSAEIIRSHISYGLQLASRYNLPNEIKDAIAQHHGTTLMAIFYARAKAADPNVDPRLFRYAGPTPRTAENAIIMLADGVEAAVRSNELTDRAAILELMNKMFDDRMRSGQFADCDLTFRDMEKIKQAFLSVYDGVFHERVKYPDLDGRSDG